MPSSSLSIIIAKALKMALVGPTKVVILSGQFPSEMLIHGPLYSCILTDSFFLMILPTSFPCISSQMVRAIFNPSITPVSTSSSVLDSWTLVKSLVAGWVKAKNCRSEATEGKKGMGGKGKSRWLGAE